MEKIPLIMMTVAMIALLKVSPGMMQRNSQKSEQKKGGGNIGYPQM
jgi:hypothetical protein